MDHVLKAKELGFSNVIIIPSGMIACDEEIRALCTPDKCGNYGSGWICPPGCGSIENCRATVTGYKNALLIQSLNENVDYSDGEKLLCITKEHNRRAVQLFEEMRKGEGDAYLLTTGGCDLCEKCTFPGEPCRVPDKNRGSLSAFGINVAKLCEKAGMEYSFVNGTIRMMACILY